MAHPKAKLHTAFRIFYNSVYFLFHLILLALLVAVPGDIIRQAYLYTFQYANIIIISGVYLLSVIIVLFVYFLRLYITRTVLAGIPRSTIPIKKGDVKKQVRQMIAKDLGRSAAIAWEARPKVTGPNANPHTLGIVAEEDNEYEQQHLPDEKIGDEKLRRSPFSWPTLKNPNSPDLPNLQYSTVLSELPNLIEAKAVSQAPVDRNASPDQPAFDPEAVSMLQRAPHMGLRDYVLHLTSLGVIPSATSRTVSDFLDAYERGRFLAEAHVERGVPGPDAPVRRGSAYYAAAEPVHSQRDERQRPRPRPRRHEQHVHRQPQQHRRRRAARVEPDDARGGSIHSLASSSSLSLRTPASRILSKRPAMLQRTPSGVSSWRHQQYGTAPSTPITRTPGPRTPGTGRSGGVGGRLHRAISARSSSTNSNSGGSFAQTRPVYGNGNGASSYGSDGGSSLRRSASQASGGSVIRLARREDGVDLPYVLRIGDSF
ncbi:sucrase/ferredoxin domain-containing protein [Apiospora hydei]|uniref:Defect at low temperature protein 1 n=1 Tax=Apiospora hydei TaxID=1337664 RepID=A0ABR1XEB1_9PEZI